MGQCCATLNGYIYSQYDGYDPIPGQDTSPLPYSSSSSSSSSTSTHSVAGGSAVLLADVIAEDVALSIQANLDDIGLSEQVSVADLVALPAVLRGPSTEALSALTTRDLSPLNLSPAQADAVFTAVQRSTGGRVRPDKGKKGKSPGSTRNRRRRRRRRHKSRGCCAMTPGSMAWQPPPFGQIADNRPHRTLFQELEEHGVQASELEREQLTPELLSTVLTSVYDLVYMEPGDLNDSPLTPAQRTALLRVATALRTKLHRKFAATAAAGGGGGGGGGGGRAPGTSAGTGKTASRPPNAAAKSEAAVEKGEGSESGTDNGQHGKKHSDECDSATTTTTTDEKPGRSEEAAHLALAEARRTAREPLRRIFATIARVESDFLQGRDLQAIMSAEMGRHLTFKGGGAASGSGGTSGRDSNDGTSGSTKGEEEEEEEEENDSGGDRDGNVDDGEEEEQEVPVGSSAAGAGIGGSAHDCGATVLVIRRDASSNSGDGRKGVGCRIQDAHAILVPRRKDDPSAHRGGATVLVNRRETTVLDLACVASNATTGSAVSVSRTHISLASFPAGTTESLGPLGSSAQAPSLLTTMQATATGANEPSRVDLLGRERNQSSTLDPPVRVYFVSSASSPKDDDNYRVTLVQFSGQYNPFRPVSSLSMNARLSSSSSSSLSSDMLQVVNSDCKNPPGAAAAVSTGSTGAGRQLASTTLDSNDESGAAASASSSIYLNFSLSRALAQVGPGASIAPATAAGGLASANWSTFLGGEIRLDTSSLMPSALQKVCEDGTVRQRRPLDPGIRIALRVGSSSSSSSSSSSNRSEEKQLWCATWDPIAQAFDGSRCRVVATTNASVVCECTTPPQSDDVDAGRGTAEAGGDSGTFAVVDYTLSRISDSFSLDTPFNVSWASLVACGIPLMLYMVAAAHGIVTQPRRTARRLAGRRAKRQTVGKDKRNHEWVDFLFGIKRFEDVADEMAAADRKRARKVTGDSPSRLRPRSRSGSSSISASASISSLRQKWWAQLKASHELLAPFLAAEGPGMVRIHFLTHCLCKLTSVVFSATALFYLYSCSSWVKGVKRGGVTTAEWWVNKVAVLVISLTFNRVVSFPASWAFSRNEKLGIAMDEFKYWQRLRGGSSSSSSSKANGPQAESTTISSGRDDESKCNGGDPAAQQEGRSVSSALMVRYRFQEAVRKVQTARRNTTAAAAKQKSARRRRKPQRVRCCNFLPCTIVAVPRCLYPWFPFVVAAVQVTLSISFVVVLTGKGFLGTDNSTAAVYIGGGAEGSPCVCSVGGDRSAEALLSDWLLLVLMILATWALLSRPLTILLGLGLRLSLQNKCGHRRGSFAAWQDINLSGGRGGGSNNAEAPSQDSEITHMDNPLRASVELTRLSARNSDAVDSEAGQGRGEEEENKQGAAATAADENGNNTAAKLASPRRSSRERGKGTKKLFALHPSPVLVHGAGKSKKGKDEQDHGTGAGRDGQKEGTAQTAVPKSATWHRLQYYNSSAAVSNDKM